MWIWGSHKCYTRANTIFMEEILMSLSGSELVPQIIKNLPAMQKTQVRSPGWEDPPLKEMATHSSILALRIRWTEELIGLQSMGSQSVRHN